MAGLDAHRRPPQAFQSLYKKYQAVPVQEIKDDGSIIEPASNPHTTQLHEHADVNEPKQGPGPKHVLELESTPGLQLVPKLLSPDEQVELVSMLLHRDLASPLHNTNIHKHYHVPYSLTISAAAQLSHSTGGMPSFFNLPNDARECFLPHDPTLHRPLTTTQFLNHKLRWVTLGGQYDWTAKAYPPSPPPAFPADVGALVRRACPQMRPEAAIVNVYLPGNRLALHRDVSEASAAPLVSISLGCDALFVAGLGRAAADTDSDADADGADGTAVVRVRSGDAIVMSRSARYAWHGVPRVLPGTCPAYLADWPAEERAAEAEGQFEAWRGWMANKRINLNVRQMFD